MSARHFHRLCLIACIAILTSMTASGQQSCPHPDIYPDPDLECFNQLVGYTSSVPFATYRITVNNSAQMIGWAQGISGFSVVSGFNNGTGVSFVEFSPASGGVFPASATQQIAGRMILSGPPPVQLDIAFLDANGTVICSQVDWVDCTHQDTSKDECPRSSLVINTGYDPGTGTVIAAGQPDPHWSVVLDPLPGTTVPFQAWGINPHTAWVNPGTNSRYVSAAMTNANNVNGTYTYVRRFCASKAGKYDISIDVAADDSATIHLYNETSGQIEVVLGQTPPGATSGFIAHTTINQTVFLDPLAYDYSIRVNVQNVGSVATGLNLFGTISSSDGSAILQSDSCCVKGGMIQGFKFNDLNCDGVRSFGEPGLAGWQINLVDLNGNVIATATTDAIGQYVFQNVLPGTYLVEEVNQTGWVPSSSAGPFTVTVTEGSAHAFHFLNCPEPPAPCQSHISVEQMDKECCKYRFNVGTGIGNVVEIIYNTTGGGVTSLVVAPCPNTTNPPSVYGTASGSILFTNPPCTNPLSLDFGFYATSTSGFVNVSIDVIVDTGNGRDTCTFTTRVKCDPPPTISCDEFSVENLGNRPRLLTRRRVHIHNTMSPSSPITSVRVEMVSPPSFVSGLNLDVDGTAVAWSTNSMPATILIPQGANSPVDAVVFTIWTSATYTGTLYMTTFHQNGDSCNWKRIWRPRVISQPNVIHGATTPRSLRDTALTAEVAIGTDFLKSLGDDLVSIQVYDDGAKGARILAASLQGKSALDWDTAGTSEHRSYLSAESATLIVNDRDLAQDSLRIVMTAVIRDTVFAGGCLFYSLELVNNDGQVFAILKDTLEPGTPTVSVDEDSHDNTPVAVLVRPQPSDEFAIVQATFPLEGPWTVELVDLDGRRSHGTTVEGVPGQPLDIRIPTHSVASGTYIVRLRHRTGATRSVVINVVH